MQFRKLCTPQTVKTNLRNGMKTVTGCAIGKIIAEKRAWQSVIETTVYTDHLPTKHTSLTLLVARAPSGLFGRPVSPSFPFSPSLAYTRMRMSPGGRILIGSTCFCVCVGIPWVARRV